MRYSMVIVSMVLVFTVSACDRSPDKPSGASKTPAAGLAKPRDDHGRKAEETHPPDGAKDRHGGEIIELGGAKLGDFTLRASRDKVDFKPGGDAPIDLWIDGGVGKGVTAVRFWIGTQDARGSMKAKADIEEGKWHTHVEIPEPMPAGGKLWVEVEGTRR